MNEFALVDLVQSPFPSFVNRHCELEMCNESEKWESKQENIDQNCGFIFWMGISKTCIPKIEDCRNHCSNIKTLIEMNVVNFAYTTISMRILFN